MEQLKYIKTPNDEIIIFPMTIEHSQLKRFNPVTAGFCCIREKKVNCFGDSFSLDLKADVLNDSILATKQVLGVEAMLLMMK